MNVEMIANTPRLTFKGSYLVESETQSSAPFTKNKGTKELYDAIKAETKNDNVIYYNKGSLTDSVDFKTPALILTNDSNGSDTTNLKNITHEYNEAKSYIHNATDDALKEYGKSFCTPKTMHGLENRSGHNLKNFVGRKVREYFQIRENEFFANLMNKAQMIKQGDTKKATAQICANIASFTNKL